MLVPGRELSSHGTNQNWVSITPNRANVGTLEMGSEEKDTAALTEVAGRNKRMRQPGGCPGR